MKRRLYFMTTVGLLLTACVSCSKLESQINALEQRIAELEESKVPSVEQQIASINRTIADVQKTDVALMNYVAELEQRWAILSNKVESTDASITSLQQTLRDEMATDKDELSAETVAAKAEVIALLDAYKTLMAGELAMLGNTIDSLKAQDSLLLANVEELKAYADSEINDTCDWASATFATNEQQKALSESVATIKAQLESLNTYTQDLDTRLFDKTKELANSISALDASTKEQIETLTEQLCESISSLRTELTNAYTSLIAQEIASLEASLKGWVNEQLSAYYTAEQVDDILKNLTAISYIPDYSNGVEPVPFSRTDTGIVPGEFTLRFKVLPENGADAIAKVWQSALSITAFYTSPDSEGEINLTVTNVTSVNDILSVTVSSQGLKDEFFEGKVAANVILAVNSGYDRLLSDYIPLETTVNVSVSDKIFQNYLVTNCDLNGDGVISPSEAANILEIDVSGLGIESLDGIEMFTNLISLNCRDNNLKEINLTNAYRLSHLDVSNTVLLIVSEYLQSSIYQIGQYVSINGDTGIVYQTTSPHIISTDEPQTKIKWDYYETWKGAKSSDNGVDNTNKISSGSSAAKWCRAKGSEWYLPALNELKVIYNNRTELNSTLSAIGGVQFTTSYYWSSTEYDRYNAYELSFISGEATVEDKGYSQKVRAVRAL